MSQEISELTPDDRSFLEGQRYWVAGHLADDADASFDEVAVKVQVLQAVLDNGWVSQGETAKLQALGVVFGDVLAELLSAPWVMVEDEYGRDPALLISDDPVLLFPMTMISKRIEDGETVDVTELLSLAAEGAMRHVGGAE
jgi:hypothetical protein